MTPPTNPKNRCTKLGDDDDKTTLLWLLLSPFRLLLLFFDQLEISDENNPRTGNPINDNPAMANAEPETTNVFHKPSIYIV